MTSERDISIITTPVPKPAISTPAMTTLTPPPVNMKPTSITKQKASTLPLTSTSAINPPRKSRGFAGFLRKLSPHLRRAKSPPAQPWITVEPRTERTSVASDHSFEAALKARNNQSSVLSDPQGNQESENKQYQQNGHNCNNKSTFSVSSLLASLRPSRLDKHKKRDKSNSKNRNGTKHGKSLSPNVHSPDEAPQSWNRGRENGFPGSLKTSPSDQVG